jgi:chromosome segregation ATPase
VQTATDERDLCIKAAEQADRRLQQVQQQLYQLQHAPLLQSPTHHPGAAGAPAATAAAAAAASAPWGELAQLQVRLAAAQTRQELADEKSASLQQQLAEARQQLEGARQRGDAAEQQLRLAAAKLGRVKEKYRAKEEQLQQAKAAMAAAAQQQKTSQDQLQALLQRVRSEQRQSLSELSSSELDAGESLEVLPELLQVQKLRRQLGKHKDTIHQLQEEVQARSGELQQWRAKAAASDHACQQLQRQLSDAESALNQMQGQLEQQAHQRGAQQQQLEAVQQQVRLLQQQLAVREVVRSSMQDVQEQLSAVPAWQQLQQELAAGESLGAEQLSTICCPEGLLNTGWPEALLNGCCCISGRTRVVCPPVLVPVLQIFS